MRRIGPQQTSHVKYNSDCDAQGDVATVSIEPDGRRVHRPADGLALASFDRDGAKALREVAPLRAVGSRWPTRTAT